MADKQRLTEIPTEWTLILKANTPVPPGGAASDPVRTKALNDLIGRYHDAVARYLRLKLRDEHLADEVMQEFWSKVLNNKLAGVDPSKGRFRDYLRTILHRLIIDHFRGRKLQQLPPGELLDPASPDEDFDHVWRKVIIDRVIARLETYEVNTPKNRYATVLHLRLDHPDTPIEDLAERLGRQLDARVSPEAFRKTLQRARAKFVELLVHELKETIHPAEPEDIEAEIYDLGLGSFYRRYTEDHPV